MVVFNDDLLSPRLIIKLEDYHLSAIRQLIRYICSYFSSIHI